MGKLFPAMRDKLSHFLPRFAGFRRFAPQLLLLHSRQICNGSCTRTPASALNIDPTPWQISGSETICTATRVMLNNICAMTAKSAPYPPCNPAAHYARAGRGVTVFWPRVLGIPGPCPVLASGNTTSPYCRAVSGKLGHPAYKETFLLNLHYE